MHAASLAAIGAMPQVWPWAAGVVALNHSLLAIIGMLPRSRWLGENMIRVPDEASHGAIALTFDDGPDPVVTPTVLTMLARHGARASFFCVGARAAARPDLVRRILDGGHRIENHSMTHPAWFAALGLAGLRREIDQAQDVLASLADRAPRYFRPPMGLRSPLLAPLLAARGLHHVAWTRRGLDTIDHRPKAVLRRLLRGVSAGDILLLHDTRRAHAAPAALDALLKHLSQLGLKALPLP